MLMIMILMNTKLEKSMQTIEETQLYKQEL